MVSTEDRWDSILSAHREHIYVEEINVTVTVRGWSKTSRFASVTNYSLHDYKVGSHPSSDENSSENS